MAGNEEPKQISQPSPSSSSSWRANIEEEELQQQAKEICWRKQVDQNLKRLHPLLFGAELALDRRDFSAALILGLRLLGFLDSRSQSEVDQAFIYPIRREVAAKINAARHSLAPDSDRRAFEQAKKAPGCVFGTRGEIDIGRIKQSKYFRALLQQSNIKVENELGGQIEKHDRLSNQASKVMTQAKLTSNMTRASNGLNKGFWSSKSNNSDDCIIVEKPRSHNNQVKGHGVSSFRKVEDEDRAYGSAAGAKRAHMEISSPGHTKKIKNKKTFRFSPMASSAITTRCPSILLLPTPRPSSSSSFSPPNSVSFRFNLSRPKPISIRAVSFPVAPTSEGIAPPVTLTDNALKHLNKMRSERNEDLCLRIGVRQGGCSGMSYTMDFESRENARPDDSIIEYNGFVIVCDPKSLLFIFGMQLDYSDALIGGGFAFKNPNATQTCGCGKSFAAEM